MCFSIPGCFGVGVACSGSCAVHLWHFRGCHTVYSLGAGAWAESAVEVDYVVGCVVGVGGDRSLIILPLSLQSRLPRSDRISNLPEMG